MVRGQACRWYCYGKRYSATAVHLSRSKAKQGPGNIKHLAPHRHIALEILLLVTARRPDRYYIRSTYPEPFLDHLA